MLEFIRSWCTCRGYFDVDNGLFKKIGKFGTIMAENSEFRPTSLKTDRFLYYSTTLYTEEISSDMYKPFIQMWLTTTAWQ